MARIICIDFGLKRVGVAVTDSLKIIASGLATVENKNIIKFLEDYFSKEEVEKIVIGYPLNLDGTPTHATEAVERFIKTLNKKFRNIPVEKEDERFTSKMATKAMIEGGVKKKKRRDKSLIDKVSATIILQSYLEN
ncbi:MAG: Holliday junction resolvase RuvX [Bacteroidota bacterium]|nr:Holliday junction resolvase RuvX [Bacteroidota bacterium]